MSVQVRKSFPTGLEQLALPKSGTFIYDNGEGLVECGRFRKLYESIKGFLFKGAFGIQDRTSSRTIGDWLVIILKQNKQTISKEQLNIISQIAKRANALANIDVNKDHANLKAKLTKRVAKFDENQNLVEEALSSEVLPTTKGVQAETSEGVLEVQELPTPVISKEPVQTWGQIAIKIATVAIPAMLAVAGMAMLGNHSSGKANGIVDTCPAIPLMISDKAAPRPVNYRYENLSCPAVSLMISDSETNRSKVPDFRQFNDFHRAGNFSRYEQLQNYSCGLLDNAQKVDHTAKEASLVGVLSDPVKVLSPVSISETDSLEKVSTDAKVTKTDPLYLKVYRQNLPNYEQLKNFHNVFDFSKYEILANDNKDSLDYKKLNWQMGVSDCTLNIRDIEGCGPVSISESLGGGGSKGVYGLGRDHVLTLPIMGIDGVSAVAQRWDRMVREEVENRKSAQSIGLLTLPIERVNLCVEGCDACETHFVPAYKSESFEHLKESKGWYILDSKNSRSSTWKGTFFENDEDRFDLKKWKSILTPLFDDIAKIIYYELGIGTDQKNLVVIKTNNINNPNYIVRYFGFDFSDKWFPMRIQKGSPIKNLGRGELKFLESLLEQFLQSIIDVEFPLKGLASNGWRIRKYEDKETTEFNDKQIENFYKLTKELTQEYKEYIEEEVKRLIEINK